MLISKTINVVKAQIRFCIDILAELIDILVELTKLDIQEEKLTMCNIIKDPKCIVGFQFSQKWSTEFVDIDNVCKGEIRNVFSSQEEIQNLVASSKEKTTLLAKLLLSSFQMQLIVTCFCMFKCGTGTLIFQTEDRVRNMNTKV